jgi:hypothetical protein
MPAPHGTDVSVGKSAFEFPDEDAPFLSGLGDASVRPVFIMGLHRSGTTFLYQSLARLFPLAPLRAYHIIFYRRLLSRRAQGLHTEDQALLDRFFSQEGVSTRQIDNIGLSHQTVEEYCWLLKKHGGSVYLTERTSALFEEMCRKLLFLRADAENVLMKNPWDTKAGPRISALLPGSRFIYISRDPVRILNSQLQAAATFAAHYSPYLDLLLPGFPLARFTFFVERTLWRVLGAHQFRALMTRRLMHDIIRELTGYREAVERLPPEVCLQTSYEQLSASPGHTLGRIGEFLGLAPVMDPGVIVSRPRRSGLLPEVEAVRAPFEERLEALSLMPVTRT